MLTGCAKDRTYRLFMRVIWVRRSWHTVTESTVRDDIRSKSGDCNNYGRPLIDESTTVKQRDEITGKETGQRDWCNTWGRKQEIAQWIKRHQWCTESKREECIIDNGLRYCRNYPRGGRQSQKIHPYSKSSWLMDRIENVTGCCQRQRNSRLWHG